MASEQKSQADWEWWTQLLTISASLLQERADEGVEHARLSVGDMTAHGLDRGPAALVERLHKHESRISALRARLKQLDEREQEIRAHMNKASLVGLE